MGSKRRRRLSVWLALLVAMSAFCWASGHETEAQLLQRIQNEQNPVKKAKYEIKLANLKLMEVQDAYSQGNIDGASKLLGTFLEYMKTSWQFLQASGRKAVKQPEGFRELEISLREDARVLEDVARRLPYFDRGPVEKAGRELERMRVEVLQALFPAGKSPSLNAAPPPQKPATPGNPAPMR
jgi:hypothetical protein